MPNPSQLTAHRLTRGRRLARRVTGLACAAMIVATVVALAGNHPGRASAGSISVANTLPPPVPSGPGGGGAGRSDSAIAPPTAAGSPGGIAPSSVGGAPPWSTSPSVVGPAPGPGPGSASADSGAVGSSGGGSGGGGAGGSPPAGSGSPAPPSPGTSVVVVSPVLQLMSLGSRVVVPLVCSVAAGAAGSVITDPTTSAVVAKLVATCATMANQGADELGTLDGSLAQLAAVNPAVRPWLDRLAAAFRQAASANIPFARSVMDLAALLQFLSG